MIQQHLDGAGVSVDIVFSLEVIERCLTRTALMTEIMESPADARRSRAIRRLLSRLVLSAYEDRSLRHLFGWNMQLLGRKIVERSSETGEHYIARNLHEYRHIWLAAAGGGALTVGTGVVKTLIHSWHLPPLPEGLLYGLNYAVSFVFLQHLGLILATKQPAMTAARLASIIRESEGEDREERVAVTPRPAVSWSVGTRWRDRAMASGDGVEAAAARPNRRGVVPTRLGVGNQCVARVHAGHDA